MYSVTIYIEKEELLLILKSEGKNMKGKRLLALCLSVIMLLSVFSTAAYAEDTNFTADENLYITDEGMYVYKYEDSDLHDETIEELASFEKTANGVIGEDSRKRINNTKKYPYSACVSIYCFYDSGADGLKVFSGSGNMIGKYNVLTAAHVIYNDDYGFPKRIVIRPSFDGTESETSYSCSPENIFFYPNYINGNKQEKRENDIAVIQLGAPIGRVIGTFGYSSKTVSVGDTLTSSGYPGDKADRGLYESSGTAVNVTESNISYNLDVFAGQSGSGVYDSLYNIVAVSTYVYSPLGIPIYNSGVRINAQKKSWLDKINATEYNPVYRMYNRASGEHFFTADADEAAELKRTGWAYEGVAWNYAKSGMPVYRLYNSENGEHFYTADSNEENDLVNNGWKYEGVAFYMDALCTENVNRLYNPNAVSNNHHFTVNEREKNRLIADGWTAEGTAFYGY